MLKKIGSLFHGFDWFFNGTLTGECLAFQRTFPFVGMVRSAPGAAGPRLLPRQWWFPFIFLLFALVYGPTSPPDGFYATNFLVDTVVNVTVTLGSLYLFGWGLDRLLHFARATSWLFWLQFAVVGGGMAFFLYAISKGHLDPDNPQWCAGPPTLMPHLFPHLWLPLAFLAFCVALPARWIAWFTLKNLARRIQAHPNFANLSMYVGQLATEKKPEPKTSFLRSVFDALSSPVEILFPPALFLVGIDNCVASQFVGTTPGLWVYYLFAGALGLGALVMLVCAEHFNTFAAMRLNVRRIFLFGGSYLVTVFVIGLAACWLMDIGYVKTVMDGSRLTIVSLVLASYALFWTYEYWANHAYSVELLAILGKVHGNRYVEFGAFRVCVHGTAKFSLVEQADSNTPATPLRVFDAPNFSTSYSRKWTSRKRSVTPKFIRSGARS